MKTINPVSVFSLATVLAVGTSLAQNNTTALLSTLAVGGLICYNLLGKMNPQAVNNYWVRVKKKQ